MFPCRWWPYPIRARPIFEGALIDKCATVWGNVPSAPDAANNSGDSVSGHTAANAPPRYVGHELNGTAAAQSVARLVHRMGLQVDSGNPARRPKRSKWLSERVFSVAVSRTRWPSRCVRTPVAQADTGVAQGAGLTTVLNLAFAVRLAVAVKVLRTKPSREEASGSCAERGLERPPRRA
jgi:hypothetical protein